MSACAAQSFVRCQSRSETAGAGSTFEVGCCRQPVSIKQSASWKAAAPLSRRVANAASFGLGAIFCWIQSPGGSRRSHTKSNPTMLCTSIGQAMLLHFGDVERRLQTASKPISLSRGDILRAGQAVANPSRNCAHVVSSHVYSPLSATSWIAGLRPASAARSMPHILAVPVRSARRVPETLRLIGRFC